MRDRYASLREGLVGAWIPSVSGSGLLLPDLSGNGNNGTLTNMGPEDWVSSQYGRALDFDGVNDYVTATCDSQVFTTGKWTLTAWIYHRSGGGAFFGIGDTTTTSRYVHLINNGGTLQSNIVGPVEGTVVVQAGSIISNQWYHVAIVMESTGLSIYKSGEKSLISVVSGTNNNKTFAANQLTAVAIGALTRSTTSVFLDGVNLEFRIYNRALSEPEIKLLSQEPGVGFKRTRSVFDFGRKPAYLPPTPTDYRTVRVKQTEHASLREGLVGAWCPSIEGSGYTLPDLSGQGNNGTLTNMGPEDWVAGEYGRALDFDGNNDYSTIPMNPIFNMPNVKTISCWLYARAFDGAFSVNDIITTDNIGSGDRTWIIVAADSDNDNVDAELRIASNGTGGGRNVITTSSEVLAIEKWHHIAATTIDGLITVSDVCLYVDGIKQAVTDLSTGTYTAPLPLTSNNPLRFGFRAGTTVDIKWNGQLDDIRIYNRALSESEIKLLASRPGIGLRPQRRTMYYAPPTGARRRRILTSMP